MTGKNRHPGRQIRSGTIALFLFVLTVVAYARVFQNGFVFDDEQYVTKNPYLLSSQNLSWAFTATYASNWHPLTWLSLQLDNQLYGVQRPWGFHLTNLLLHAANVLLLFTLLRRLTGALWRSAIVAALFAVHPLHVESVAWVAERKDVLSTFFGWIALWLYVSYVESRRPGTYPLLLLSFGLSLMAKPMLVTLPFLLLLLDYWPLGRWQVGLSNQPRASRDEVKHAAPRWSGASLRLLVLEKLPLLALVVGSCLATLRAQHLGSLEKWSLGIRIENALVATIRYLGMMLWPTRLAVYYPHPGAALPVWQPIAAGVVLLLITALVVFQLQRRPYLAVGWFWYLGTLLPVIGLVQVGDQALADRYTYVPLIGIFVILAWGGQDLLAFVRVPPFAGRVLAGIVVLSCAIMTVIQVGYWRDEVTLWQHALDVTGDNARAHNNLGTAFFNRQQWRRAEEHYTQAVRLDPADANAQHNLALLLDKQGKLREAMEHYLAAARLDPSDPVAANDLGLALAREGRGEEAIESFVAAMRLDPNGFKQDNTERAVKCVQAGQLEEARQHLEAIARVFPEDADVQYSLGSILLRAGRTKEAGDHLERALAVAPSMARGHASLAYAFAEQGRTEEAELHYRRALQLDPAWPGVLSKNAWVLATDPDARKRNGKLAVIWAKQVCQATKNARPEYLDILAAAYAESGRFDEAVSTAKQALSAVATTSATGFAQRIQERLHLYEKGQPYRQDSTASRP
jgi:tetratricopeptide (TPR) repeat protein